MGWRPIHLKGAYFLIIDQGLAAVFISFYCPGLVFDTFHEAQGTCFWAMTADEAGETSACL